MCNTGCINGHSLWVATINFMLYIQLAIATLRSQGNVTCSYSYRHYSYCTFPLSIRNFKAYKKSQLAKSASMYYSYVAIAIAIILVILANALET